MSSQKPNQERIEHAIDTMLAVQARLDAREPGIDFDMIARLFDQEGDR